MYVAGFGGNGQYRKGVEFWKTCPSCTSTRTCNRWLAVLGCIDLKLYVVWFGFFLSLFQVTVNQDKASQQISLLRAEIQRLNTELEEYKTVSDSVILHIVVRGSQMAGNETVFALNL